eukprot:TRINITY_DN7880_c0_g1_i1.p1 TRINITY_DN7880_c0_g1~~TRINITY_DN7880_c0_g1_i1.p1  ORF type:complete len:306 (+),score=46.24 TRINITY_DN7880_c0_g1_i1:50-967(+)
MLQDSFSTAEIQTLLDLTYASATLTAFGCLYIILSYALFPHLRNMSFTLVFWLSVSDLFCSLSFFVSALIDFSKEEDLESHEQMICDAQGALIQYFNLSTFLWTLAISYSIFKVVFSTQSQFSLEMRYIHLLCWGIPLACSATLVFSGKIGPAGIWCWIEDPTDPLRFFFFYGPASIIILINVALYFAALRSLEIHRRLSRASRINEIRSSQSIEEFGKKISKRSLYVILSFAFCWIWGITNRIQNLIYPDNPQFFLYCAHSFFTPLFGFCNSVVYGFSRNMRQEYRKLLSREPSYENVYEGMRE